jgi:hypothetical protein
MVRRLLRAALFAGVVLLVWTVSRSASAAISDHAPFCDDRGASALAPAPALESPSDVIDRVRAASSCTLNDIDAIGRAFAPSHRSFETPASSYVPALWRAAPTVTAPPGEDLALDGPVTPTPIEVHFRVERPPRG